MSKFMFQSMLLEAHPQNGQKILVKKFDTDADNELVGTAIVELPWFATIVYIIVEMTGAVTLLEVDAQVDKWRKT